LQFPQKPATIEACGNGLWFFSRSAASDRRDRSVRAPRSVKGAVPHDLTPLLLQHEDQFAYEVTSRALDRSADGNRFLDTLFFALMAAQTATFAMLLGKAGGYAALECTLTLSAFGLALAGAGLSVFIGDGPDPSEFMAEFPRDPQATRSAHVDEYLV
jgi:hypothetical protein